MANDKKIPEYLYRGMIIDYEKLKNFIFTGIDMELPYEPYIDEQGRKTVHDGNEYGIYMSDNLKMVENAYGNVNGGGTDINKEIYISFPDRQFIRIPDVGVIYKISTKNLEVRTPWVSSELQGHYNNGFSGDEWIADKIPAENYEVIRVRVGKDILHDEQDIELDDIEHLREKTIDIVEQRKARLEVFAREMAKIPESTREGFDQNDVKVLKEIYGENGFKYMSDLEEIDTTSTAGMIKYLMAKVYDNDRDNIDFITLRDLQKINEKVKIAEKKGKQVDLSEIIKKEELLELIRQKASKDKEAVSKDEGIKVTNGNTQNVMIDNIATAITQNPVSLEHFKEVQAEIANQVNQRAKEKQETVIDYYEKYAINPDDDIKEARKKIMSELGKWRGRQSSSVLNGQNKTIEDEIKMATEALKIFNPKHRELLKDYNKRLRESKQKDAKTSSQLQEGISI